MYNPQSFADELIKIAMDDEDKADLKRGLATGALGATVGFGHGAGKVYHHMGDTVPLIDTKGKWGKGDPKDREVVRLKGEKLTKDTRVTAKAFKDSATGKVQRHTQAVVDDVAGALGRKKALRYGAGALGIYGTYALGKRLFKRNKDKEASATEHIPGGLAEGMKDSEFIRDELEEGVRDESSEHTPVKVIAKEIAKDHLAKDPHYYSHLKKMEKKMEKSSAVHDAIKMSSLIKYTKRGR